MVWKDSQLAAANPDMDFKERLRTVGEEARRLRGPRAVPTAVDQQRRTDKEQRKASVRSIPVAGGRQADEIEEAGDYDLDGLFIRIGFAIDAIGAKPPRGLVFESAKRSGFILGADVAGLTASYEAYKASLGGKPAPVLDGLTGDQRFYLAYSQSWREIWTDGLMRQTVLSNPTLPRCWSRRTRW